MASNDSSFSKELLEKAKACTSPEELKALMESEDVELSDEALEAIAGGKSAQIPIEEFLKELLGRPIQGLGDTREDIDSDRVPAAFASGDIDGSAFF